MYLFAVALLAAGCNLGSADLTQSASRSSFARTDSSCSVNEKERTLAHCSAKFVLARAHVAEVPLVEPSANEDLVTKCLKEGYYALNGDVFEWHPSPSIEECIDWAENYQDALFGWGESAQECYDWCWQHIYQPCADVTPIIEGEDSRIGCERAYQSCMDERCD